MGNTGIIRELLRYARLSAGGSAEYAVRRPDHPVTGNAGTDNAGTDNAVTGIAHQASA
jgi:hypothetical protein